jgi:hypothetical protein
MSLKTITDVLWAAQARSPLSAGVEDQQLVTGEDRGERVVAVEQLLERSDAAARRQHPDRPRPRADRPRDRREGIGSAFLWTVNPTENIAQWRHRTHGLLAPTR